MPDYRLRLVYGDLEDGSSLSNLVKKIMPDEIYNLAAQSHVRVSFDVPEYTCSTVGMGTLRLLEAVREMDIPLSLAEQSWNWVPQTPKFNPHSKGTRPVAR